MTSRLLTRAAFAAVASVTVLMPLAGCGTDNNGQSAPPPSRPSTPQPPSDQTGTESTKYADGTYSARGVYGGAPSYMDFTITLDDGVITEVESELMTDNNDTSRGYQERFAAAVGNEVIGESIADLEIGVIAGASGCADGFNDALATIREEAATRS